MSNQQTYNAMVERMIHASKLRHCMQEVGISFVHKGKPGRPKKIFDQKKVVVQKKRKPIISADPEFTKKFVKPKPKEKNKFRYVRDKDPLPEQNPSPIDVVGPVDNAKDKPQRPPAVYSNSSPYGIASDYIQNPDKYGQG